MQCLLQRGGRSGRKSRVFCVVCQQFRIHARITRNHRLWERYLIKYADIAPSHVDRDADLVEHILGAELVSELETLRELHPLRERFVAQHMLALYRAGRAADAESVLRRGIGVAEKNGDIQAVKEMRVFLKRAQAAPPEMG